MKEMKYKTFRDLKFKRHPVARDDIPMFADAKQAKLEFGNGYGVSVLSGGAFYTSPGTYELGVTKDGSLTYKSGITKEVLGYLSEKRVTEVMKQVQDLRK